MHHFTAGGAHKMNGVSQASLILCTATFQVHSVYVVVLEESVWNKWEAFLQVIYQTIRNKLCNDTISKVLHIICLLTPLFFWDYLFTIVQSPCFSMIESQRFGSIIIPSKTWLLLMYRIVNVVRKVFQGKKWPRVGSFNFGNKSKSGGLMSGLQGAWGNTSHK